MCKQKSLRAEQDRGQPVPPELYRRRIARPRLVPGSLLLSVAVLAQLSQREIPSALEPLSFQQIGDRLLTNDDFSGQRSPGGVKVGSTVSFGAGI